jgi:hypothetical protein
MPHKALDWWALVLAVVSLVLLLPASIFANLITPKVKDWWTEGSQALLLKRIAALEEELGRGAAIPPISEVEDFILLQL